MNKICTPFKLTALAALIGAAIAPGHLFAAALTVQPEGTERLSALLARQGWLPGLIEPEYRLSSLLVLAPKSADAIEQQMTRDRAVQALRTANRNNTALQQVLQRVGAMPVNGRLQLESTDANYLQARPEYDPVLNSAYTVVLPQGTNTVTVLSDLGTCVVPHQPVAAAQAYIEACLGQQSAWKGWLGVDTQVDWTWVANPNGRVERLAVNGWNEQPQGAPAPGSWLWAPSRQVAGEQRDGTVTVFMANVSFVRVDFCIASRARRTCICFAALLESSSVKPAARIACGIFRKEAASWIVAACSTFLLKSLSFVDMLRIDYLGGAGQSSSLSQR
mgnify:CR=1 FL=1